MKEVSGMAEVMEKLASIESLLQRMPELIAATLLIMQDERDDARLAGLRAADLWDIAPVNRR